MYAIRSYYESSPFGTVEYPFRPGELVLGARGYFFARCIDKDLKHQVEVMKAAAKHEGASVIEVLQNCVIFNDQIHSEITDKEHKADRTIYLEHGQPMIFGKNRDKGLILEGLNLKVVTIGENGITEDDILVHDAHCEDMTLQMKLTDMEYPNFPVALGVIRDAEALVYDQCVQLQIEGIQEQSDIKSFDDLVRSGDTWEVE